MAAKDSVMLVTQMGLQNFILESDSLYIVVALRDPSPNMSVIGHIIKDMKALLASVTEASSTHVRRQANGVAHCLARATLLCGINCTWDGASRELISDLLFKEANMKLYLSIWTFNEIYRSFLKKNIYFTGRSRRLGI